MLNFTDRILFESFEFFMCLDFQVFMFLHIVKLYVVVLSLVNFGVNC